MQVSVQPSRQAVCIYTSVCEHVNKRPHTLSSFNVRLAGVFQNRHRRLVRGAANEYPLQPRPHHTSRTTSGPFGIRPLPDSSWPANEPSPLRTNPSNQPKCSGTPGIWVPCCQNKPLPFSKPAHLECCRAVALNKHAVSM